jgi:hypothetical protein
MPYLDRQDIHDYINEAQTEAHALQAVTNVFEQSYSVFQCPNDSRHFKQPGGLSYAANIGFGPWRGTRDGVSTHYDFGATDHGLQSLDWNGNNKSDQPDRDFAKATGVFWMPDATQYHCTLDAINKGDGTSSTLLFAESLTLPFMHLTGPKLNGLNPRSLDAGFGLGIDALGLTKNANPSFSSLQKGHPTAEYTQYFKPNCDRHGAKGVWPGASSNHTGVVNVVYAGGNTGTISNDIDSAVWAALHTPFGRSHGELVVHENEY